MTRPPRLPRLPSCAATAAAAAAAAVLLAGCASPGPTPAPAPLITPAAAGLAAPAAVDPAAAFPPESWWTALGDPALDALVQAALAGQPGLAAAQARLAAADAAAAAVQAGVGPQAVLSADVTRQRFPEHGLVPPAVAGSVRNTANLSVGGRWSLDFFGRHAAALAAAIGRQRAAAAEADAARQLLAAQLSQAWVALARLLAQQEIAQETLAQRAQVRQLQAERVAAGLETLAALRSADPPLRDASAQAAALDGQIAAARHRLAVLAGQAPQAQDRARPVLTDLRLASPPAHLGADLLGRRADVVAARWRVEAASQGVAAARADFYPDINLNAAVGLNALGLDRLLELGSRQLSAGPALRLPLFDGGALRAQLQGRAAEADAAVAAYNTAVLDAAREVADAAALLRSTERQRAEQQQAHAAAAEALALARARHAAGLGNRLPALQAQAALLQQQAQALDLVARQLDAQVLLAQALGGGWQPPAVLAAMPAARPDDGPGRR